MKTLLMLAMLITSCSGVEFDFGSIPESQIRATVLHLQALAKDAQEQNAAAKKEIARLGDLVQQLTANLSDAQSATGEARMATQKVQRDMDALREWAAKQERDRIAAEKTAHRRGVWNLWLTLALIIAGIWIFRKPLLAFV